ncbi:MAG: 1-(5-phosphoribosyl)-5-[(5-phosphoribosylamino)methylideneamino] imidazole-4-carboxamide isomerase [Phycisphaerales bacterium]|jgi:phosphoribosylformimino-5-aminoimidazole carboxamide ribotide isomerase|nr:1-(5-phosphoribosyl)-5-[(5-phosphoribosylamino)methylideneamino] imidazole-4-carboxamide isomerase [Phycisphaerales bacterium]
MDLLPAIDLRGGQVVRLERGDYDLQTTYNSDPGAVAASFAEAGAKWIHVVDLDAAKSGIPTNTDAIGAIRSAVGDAMKIELGGGARTTDTVVRMLDGVADRVVIGSAALEKWDWFESLLTGEQFTNDQLVLGLDAKEGRLAIHGWTKVLEETALDLGARVNGSGLGAIVYTDIARDGMLSGINVEQTAAMVKITDVGIVASGGVASLDDVRAALDIGCGGCILGKALYEGKVILKDAVELVTN